MVLVQYSAALAVGSPICSVLKMSEAHASGKHWPRLHLLALWVGCFLPDVEWLPVDGEGVLYSLPHSLK